MNIYWTYYTDGIFIVISQHVNFHISSFVFIFYEN